MNKWKTSFYLKGKKLCKIDYSLKGQEIKKAKDSFHKNNKEVKEVKEDNKNNNNEDSLKETDNYL